MSKNIFHIINKATKDHNLKHSDLRIFLCLISYNSFNKIFPSLETISIDTGIKSRPDISKGLKRLKELEYIEIKRRKHQTNIYNLNVDKIEVKKKEISKNIEVKKSVSAETLKNKSILYSVVYLYSKIQKRSIDSSDYAFIKHLLKEKQKDNISYVQKCLMLCNVLKSKIDKTGEQKYKGILFNSYRDLSYTEFCNNLSNNSKVIFSNEYESFN